MIVMTLKTTLQDLKISTIGSIQTSGSLTDLDALKTQVLGKKGQLTHVLKEVGALPPEERPAIGVVVNQLKTELEAAFQDRAQALKSAELDRQLSGEKIDVTLPGIGTHAGALHPLEQTQRRLLSLFSQLGFSVADGPEIEDEFHNFEALNIPAHHPARDMHDTFYLSPHSLLRTHTSPVQIRTMKAGKPPIRIVVPGKVYRCDADMSHSPIFHQIEGLYVNQHVSFSDLKGTLEYFLKSVFGSQKRIRFRPSFFPFTEPSCEVDVEFSVMSSKGGTAVKESRWMEILGAGLVHPNVFRAVGYDLAEVSGYAFGVGIERVTMLLYGIEDIRLFYENDLRFLSQFKVLYS